MTVILFLHFVNLIMCMGVFLIGGHDGRLFENGFRVVVLGNVKKMLRLRVVVVAVRVRHGLNGRFHHIHAVRRDLLKTIFTATAVTTQRPNKPKFFELPDAFLIHPRRSRDFLTRLLGFDVETILGALCANPDAEFWIGWVPRRHFRRKEITVDSEKQVDDLLRETRITYLGSFHVQPCTGAALEDVDSKTLRGCLSIEWST